MGWKLTGLILFGVICWWLGRSHRNGKHRDPHLHEAPENGIYLLDSGSWGKGHQLVWHLGGVPFDESDIPPWWHQCYAHTCSIGKHLSHRDRCACGGERWGVYGKWTRRDSRCLG